MIKSVTATNLNMIMQKNQSNELIKEGLFLGILSAILYITSYAFAIGYATYFNVPLELVSVDFNTLIQGAPITSISFAYYLSLFYSFKKYNKNDQAVTFNMVYIVSSLILLGSDLFLILNKMNEIKISNVQIVEFVFSTVFIFILLWRWFMWEEPLSVCKRIYFKWLEIKNICLLFLNKIGRETDDTYNQKELDRNFIIYRGQQKMTKLTAKSIYKESIFKLRIVDTPADVLSSIIIAVYPVVIFAFILGLNLGETRDKYWILDTDRYEREKLTLMKSGSKKKTGEELQVVVAFYGDKIITAPVDRKHKQVHQKFAIHHMSSETQLTLYKQEIGPLEVVK
jgi:hypothetical protein